MGSWQDTAPVYKSIKVQLGTWFPAVDVAVFRQDYNVPSELSDATIINQLQISLIEVTSALSEWQAGQYAMALEDVKQDLFGAIGVLESLFFRAVYCDAKADLLRDTASMERRVVAENLAKTANETEDKYRERSAEAISRIMGNALVKVCVL